jgi:hypothetical protein
MDRETLKVFLLHLPVMKRNGPEDNVAFLLHYFVDFSSRYFYTASRHRTITLKAPYFDTLRRTQASAQYSAGALPGLASAALWTFSVGPIYSTVGDFWFKVYAIPPFNAGRRDAA